MANESGRTILLLVFFLDSQHYSKMIAHTKPPVVHHVAGKMTYCMLSYEFPPEVQPTSFFRQARNCKIILFYIAIFHLWPTLTTKRFFCKLGRPPKFAEKPEKF